MAVKVGSFTAPASGGAPQNQVITGLGFTPKLVLLWTNGLTLEGGFDTSSDIRLSVGFSNGTQERGCCYYEENDSDPTNTRSYIDDDVFVQLDSSGSVVQRGKIDSLDSNGFTFGWDTHNNVETIIYYLAVGGADITGSHIGHFISPSGTPNQVVSGLGITPSIVFLLSTSAVAASLPALINHAFFSLSAFTDGTNKRGISISSQGDNPNTDTYTIQYNADVLDTIGITPQDILRADFEGFSPGQFEIDWEANVEGSLVAYMAIEGGDWAVGHDVLENDTGNQDVPLDFTPEAALVWGASDTLMFVPALTNVISEVLMGLGASDGANHKATWTRSRDARAQVIGITRQESDAAVLFGDEEVSPGVEGEATLSFPTDTLRSTWTVAPVAGSFLFYVAMRGGESLLDTVLHPSPIVLELTIPASQLDVTLHPAPVALDLTIPDSQLDVVLHPSPILLEITLPTSTLTAGGDLFPEPIVLALSMPATRLEVTLHPDPIVLGLAVPDTQLDVVLHPEPIVLALSVQASQLDAVFHPAPVSLHLNIPAPQLDVALYPEPMLLELLIPTSIISMPPPEFIYLTNLSLRHAILDGVRLQQ